MITFLQIAGGLLFLFIGGEVLIRGAVSLAKNLGMSTFIIGLTVVAYGTSSPELVISLKAVLGGHPDIALGNVVGSNISNILCVMGITAMIYPIAIDKKVSLLDGTFMLAVTILLTAICFANQLTFISGTIFLAILIIYTWLLFKKAKKESDSLPEEQTEEIEEQLKVKLNNWQAALACIGGGGLLIFGADILINGATTIARHFGLSEAVIGVTLIAFGGSVPELATSVIAALHKHSKIVFGNIIGSNLFNILGILGTSSMVSPIEVNKKFMLFDLPILIFVTLWLFIVMYKYPAISRKMGIAFFIGYVAYVSKQFF